MTDPAAPLHGSAFVYSGSGCLLLGPSGSGKSRLIADALMMGAKLIADDRVRLELLMGHVAASAPPELAGILELRGIGLIKIHDIAPKNIVHLVVALDPACDERLPEPGKTTLLGIELPYLRIAAAPKISVSALLLYLKAMQDSRVLPTDWRPNA